MPTEQFVEHCQRARELMRGGKLSAAVEAFEAARKIDDEDVALHEQLAVLHFQMGQYEPAIERFEHVLRLDPKHNSAMINLGAVHNKQGNYTRSIEVLRKAIAMNRKSAEGFYNLGLAHRKLKQWNMAIPAYKEAIRLEPTMAEAYQNLGNVYLDMGNPTQAISQFKKALEIRPDFERARRGLAKAELTISDQRKNENPFGRLVKPPTGEAVDHTSQQQKQLSDDDRESDRHLLHQLSEELELEARALQEMLLERMEPSLKLLGKAISDENNVAAARRKFQQAYAEFAPRVKRISRLMKHLRTHETEMR